VSSIKNHIYVGLLAGLFTILFSVTPIGELIELKGYDLFYTFKKPAHPPEDIIIVAIDEPSFAELERQWPWPRSIHAKLIETLKKEGASVIGFDILFSEPTHMDEDSALAHAIKQSGNVCLASDIEVIQRESYVLESVIEPLPHFMESSHTGVVTIPLDKDNIVRRFYTHKETGKLFAEQIARIYTEKKHNIPENASIYYTGEPGSFTTVSYYQALEPSVYLPKNFFRGKIVIIGLLLKTATEPRKSGPDIFFTPFLFAKNSGQMSGSEIQANMVYNVLNGTFVTRLKRYATFGLFLILGLIGSLLQIRWRPVLSGVFPVLAFIFYITTAYYLFQTERLWLPTVLAVIPLSIPYGVFGTRAYLQSEKKKREIRKAFSHYLSPAILETILAHPENLKLGGSKVEATILFADIAEFTSISEQISPEDVAKLLNASLDELTKIIIMHRGTIDKFIGDAIMSFWGAPLPDPDHAMNACRAAISMQERMKSLREKLKKDGLPEISIRIGINTGDVIVGNMGSSELFNYTVLGDPVNLASRLETINKELGTSIIISSSVYEKVSGRVTVRSIGSVQIKGRIEAADKSFRPSNSSLYRKRTDQGKDRSSRYIRVDKSQPCDIIYN
jgi:adenylate cyclase